MLTPEGLSVLLILILHSALFIWSLRSILRSDISWFERSTWILLTLVIPLLGSGIYYTYKENYFTADELFHLTAAIIILGFIFSFRLWGTDTFSISTGTNNWLRMCGLALLAYAVHFGSQKAMARHFDMITHFRLWLIGAIFGIILAFITNGWFKWAALGLMVVSVERFSRVGKKSDANISTYDIAKIIATGSFASIGLAVLTKMFESNLPAELAKQFFSMNIWIAVFSVIPFMIVHFWSGAYTDKFTHKKGYGDPSHRWGSGMQKEYYFSIKQAMKTAGKHISEGEWLFFGSRLLWVFTAVFVLSCTFLLLFAEPIVAVFISLFLAGLMFVLWNFYLEPHSESDDPLAKRWKSERRR